MGYMAMKINIIAVGKLKEKYWTDAVKEYSKRISRYSEVSVIEIPEGKNLDEEGKAIIKKAKGFVIVMDIDGQIVTSNDIATTLSNCLVNGKSEFSVIIGSSEGLCDEVKNIANIKLSLGKVTYPHQLMRVIVFEQFYRAITIIKGLTYHK